MDINTIYNDINRGCNYDIHYDDYSILRISVHTVNVIVESLYYVL